MDYTYNSSILGFFRRMIWSFLVALIKNLLNGGLAFPELMHAVTEKPPIRKIASSYLSNLKQMESLAAANNKKIIFYLQPCIGSSPNSPLSKDEELSIIHIKQRVYLSGGNQYQMNKMFYDLARQQANEELTNWTDLSSVFDDAIKPIWFDQVHFSDRGNKIIAEKISSDIKKIIQAGEQA